MSNRNGHGPLMQGQQMRSALELAADQGRQQGFEQARQAIMNAPVTVRTIEFLEDGRVLNRPFESLSQPVVIQRPGQVLVAGGMTTRLAVAAHLMGPLMAGSDSAAAARYAIDAADILIAMEKADRAPNTAEQAANPADPVVESAPEESKTIEA